MYDIAVITGASSGIGKALYTSLSYMGFKEVVGVSRRGPDIALDLSEQIPLGMSFVRPNQQVDLLINCAGIMPLTEHGKEFEIMQVNFFATYQMIETLLPTFSKGSCIINIASISGMLADAYLPIYAASKAAVISLTRSYAKRLAPKTRVNCISPGFYQSNLVPGKTPSDLIDTIPLGYEEHPKNLTSLVQMIYETKYITGSNIVIDGGVSL